MRKINHSKYKNTGFLFEILTRQITAETIEGIKGNKAVSLVKKYFNKNTELYKEYALYQALFNKKFVSESRAQSYIDKVTSIRGKLNGEKLRSEKYNLVKEIKDTYDLKEMFATQLNNYKVYGSIYILFESNRLEETVNIEQVQNCNDVVLDFMLKGEESKPKESKVIESYVKSDKEIRNLAYKMMIDRFNKKYAPLNRHQKKLLKEYINNVSNTNSLRSYINEEVDKLKSKINNHLDKTSSDITKIKLTESINLLDRVKKGSTVKDEQLKAMLYYYELVDELEKVNGK